MKPRHELIIFDWDGTLMDSIARIVRCFTAAVDDVGLPQLFRLRDDIAVDRKRILAHDGNAVPDQCRATLPARDQ